MYKSCYKHNWQLLQPHEALQGMGRDRDSENGSFTDSGRGHSEEGEMRPTFPDLRHQERQPHKGKMHKGSSSHSETDPEHSGQKY